METSDPALRYTFKKKEILRGKRAFDHLFEHGSSFRMGVLKFYYLVDFPPELVNTHLSVAFSAPKRSFRRAPDRNLIKRRLREAFRQHKHILIPSLKRKQKCLVFLIKYDRRYLVPYASMSKAIKAALYKMKEEVESLEIDTDTTD